MNRDRPTLSPPPRPTRGASVQGAGNARLRLKQATAEAHDRLDRVVSGFDLGEREGYAGFLLAQAAAFPAVETALARAGADQIVEGWATRRRSAALRRDMEMLGLAFPISEPAPTLTTPAEVLGACYVLEGSRLGGAMLIRTVGSGLPTAFLTPGPPEAWRSLVSLLDQHLVSEQSVAQAVTAASAVFALFEQAARLQIGACRS